MMYTKKKPDAIREMFGRIASDYDRANSVLSFRLHKVWNRTLIERALRDFDGDSLLDLCCGTGEIGLLALKADEPPSSVTFLDFCPQMLDHAKQKAALRSFPYSTLAYVQADAQQIPLENESFDAVTVAYGIRNVADAKTCMQEVFRVLRDGGRFAILELTRPGNSLLRSLHRVYLTHVLPKMGKLIAKDRGAYEYLCQSIKEFSDPESLAKMLGDVGFQRVEIEPLSFGSATILIATK